jgi:hypothetical protein
MEQRPALHVVARPHGDSCVLARGFDHDDHVGIFERDATALTGPLEDLEEPAIEEDLLIARRKMALHPAPVHADMKGSPLEAVGHVLGHRAQLLFEFFASVERECGLHRAHA